MTTNDLLDPGLGGAVRGMWRSVYRKAAEAAEARLQALLSEHVYQLHGRRAVAVVMSGGGSALAAGTQCDLEAPWAYVIEGWALYADASGSCVVDLRTAASYAAFPTVASICASAKPTLAAAQKATDSTLTGWTTALPRGTVLRVVVESASTVTLVSLTLFLRAV